MCSIVWWRQNPPFCLRVVTPRLSAAWISDRTFPLHGAHTGISSKNDDDGSENIAKQMDLRPFKLYRVYLKPHNSSNVGEFSWSWILSDFIHVQRKDNLSSYVHALHKTLRWEVSRRSHAVDVKEMYLSAWCTCRAVVLLIKPIVFWRCRCRRGSCLSSLIILGRRRHGLTISCKSLYFVHRSLELVPLVAFECRLRGSNFWELITIWLYYFVNKNT